VTPDALRADAAPAFAPPGQPHSATPRGLPLQQTPARRAAPSPAAPQGLQTKNIPVLFLPPVPGTHNRCRAVLLRRVAFSLEKV